MFRDERQRNAGIDRNKKSFDRESKGNHVVSPCLHNGMGVQLISLTGVPYQSVTFDVTSE